MKEYKNIEKVNTLDDGSMSVFMKNGKEIIVEVIRFNEKFQAAIYSLFTPEVEMEKKRKSLMVELEKKHDILKECTKEALGWIDENHMDFVEWKEIKTK